MHEFKHGEPESGAQGKGGLVRSRRQAITIALNEAGESGYRSDRDNPRKLRRTERKEARGETARQEREGAARVGASGQRESTPAMGGEDARRPTARGRKAAAARARRPDGPGFRALYAEAQRRNIEGRSKMSKLQLKNAPGVS